MPSRARGRKSSNRAKREKARRVRHSWEHPLYRRPQKKLLWTRRPVGRQSFRAPNLRMESSFSCWIGRAKACLDGMLSFSRTLVLLPGVSTLLFKADREFAQGTRSLRMVGESSGPEQSCAFASHTLRVARGLLRLQADLDADLDRIIVIMNSNSNSTSTRIGARSDHFAAKTARGSHTRAV